jgi:hypothetical protein
LHPQGKNVSHQEFGALGDMLAHVSWELPQAQEYKNDLVQPDFLGLEGVPKSTTMALLPTAERKPDPAGPAHDEQWKNK